MKEKQKEKVSRLDKFISNNSVFSRSDIRKLIKTQRIEINGKLASSTSQIINEKIDQIFVDGKHVQAIGLIYLMLHKPVGYVCATTDSEHSTVIDLIRAFAQQHTSEIFQRILLCDLQIVGRLDIDTTGLVLLTNDGDWNHKITSPHHHCKKTYFVTLADPITIHTQAQFMQGVQLEGDKKLTRPAPINIVTPTKVRVTITEGRYHQVKRMFAATGNRVVALHREQIGSIKLCKGLNKGEARFLTENEVQSIQKIDHLL